MLPSLELCQRCSMDKCALGPDLSVFSLLLLPSQLLAEKWERTEGWAVSWSAKHFGNCPLDWQWSVLFPGEAHSTLCSWWQIMEVGSPPIPCSSSKLHCSFIKLQYPEYLAFCDIHGLCWQCVHQWAVRRAEVPVWGAPTLSCWCSSL